MLVLVLVYIDSAVKFFGFPNHFDFLIRFYWPTLSFPFNLGNKMLVFEMQYSSCRENEETILVTWLIAFIPPFL